MFLPTRFALHEIGRVFIMKTMSSHALRQRAGSTGRAAAHKWVACDVRADDIKIPNVGESNVVRFRLQNIFSAICGAFQWEGRHGQHEWPWAIHVSAGSRRAPSQQRRLE